MQHPRIQVTLCNGHGAFAVPAGGQIAAAQRPSELPARGVVVRRPDVLDAQRPAPLSKRSAHRRTRVSLHRPARTGHQGALWDPELERNFSASPAANPQVSATSRPRVHDREPSREEYAWSVLHRSWHEAISEGGARRARTCPACDNETLVADVLVRAHGNRLNWVCFNCMTIVPPDGIDECLRCGELMLIEEDSGAVCDGCLRDAIERTYTKRSAPPLSINA